MTIVVSEERGVVSVAEAGELQEIKTASGLKSRLETFLQRMTPPISNSLWNRLFIEYGNLRQDIELTESAPSEARLTLTASERDFRFVDPGNLKVTLDLESFGVGYHELVVAASNVRLPSSVEFYRIEPRVLRLTVRNRKPVRVASENRFISR